MDFKFGESSHFAMLVRGSADICARVLMGDLWNCQHVGLLEALRRKFSFRLEKEKGDEKMQKGYSPKDKQTNCDLVRYVTS